MTRRSSFWSACESIPGLAAVEAEWKEKAGEDYAAARAFLKPRQEPATSCLCPRKNPCGCYHRVVDHGNGRLSAVCCCEPQACDTVPVTESELVVYELDRRKLHAAIGKALSLRLNEAVVPNLRKTTQVGFDSPYAGLDFPVYLTVQYDPDDFSSVVSAITALQVRPFILISATAQFHTSTTRSLLETRKAFFLTLSDIIRLRDSGRAAANPAAAVILDKFHENVLPKTEKHPPVSFFPTPDGSTWGDVHLRIDTEHVADVRAKTASGTYDFSQMGMINRTNNKPSVQWKLLLAFRNGRGMLTWDSSEAHRRNKKRKQLLAESLQRFFRIKGDPFWYDEDAKGWRILFHFD